MSYPQKNLFLEVVHELQQPQLGISHILKQSASG